MSVRRKPGARKHRAKACGGPAAGCAWCEDEGRQRRPHDKLAKRLSPDGTRARLVLYFGTKDYALIEGQAEDAERRASDYARDLVLRAVRRKAGRS